MQKQEAKGDLYTYKMPKKPFVGATWKSLHPNNMSMGTHDGPCLSMPFQPCPFWCQINKGTFYCCNSQILEQCHCLVYKEQAAFCLSLASQWGRSLPDPSQLQSLNLWPEWTKTATSTLSITSQLWLSCGWTPTELMLGFTFVTYPVKGKTCRTK